MLIDGLNFVMTCGACPEQYDVFKGEDQVGYIRLRHGVFRVDCPECSGATVFEHVFDDMLGSFDGAEQKEEYLTIAAKEINKWLESRAS